MPRDIIDLLQEDHDEVRGLFAKLDATPPADREALFHEIVGALARHEAAEEAIVHPTFEDEVDAAAAEQFRSEEQEAEELLAEMEHLDPESDEFSAAFRRLREVVLDHAEHEEREEFPRLREAVPVGRREEMGEGFERMKKMAPTRPHPNAPNAATAQVALGPIVGLFDRARDAARSVFPGS